MIEDVVFFALGFSIAALVAILLLPALWRRARRISTQQLEMRLPMSLGEVAAEHSRVRVECAFRERRLHQEMRALRASQARVMAHSGRRAACIIDLENRLDRSEIRASELDARLSQAARDAVRTNGDLVAAKSELEALKIEKNNLERTFAQTSARLHVFETRHSGGASIEKVAKTILSRPAAPHPISKLANDNVAGANDGTIFRIASGSLEWENWMEEAALEAMSPGEAIAYLQGRADRCDEGGARVLAETLGRLPITLDLAAAYCKRTRVAFAAYAAKAKTLMAVAPHRRADPGGVVAAFDLAAAEATRQVSTAETLIAFLGLCAPERIPMTLVAGVSEDKTESMAALLALRALSLVKDDRFEDGAAAISIHRLVRALARARTDAGGAGAVAIERTIIRLTEIYPVDAYDNIASWPLCIQLTPHLLAVCQTSAATGALEAERADLMMRAGGYFQARGANARAEYLFRTALAKREKEFGAMHPETAASLNKLAVLRCIQGDFDGARTLCERALAIFEKAFGPKYPHTGRHQANYARLLLMSNRPKEAFAHAKFALRTLEMNAAPDNAWAKDAARLTADALEALGQVEQAVELRARYGIMRGSLSPSTNEVALKSPRKGAWRRQFGGGLAKSWRFLSGGSVAKSN